MGIQRADLLYPVNATTVDTGAGIDIRLLDNAEAGADDDTQTANYSHTNDGVERTFDPATGGATNTNNAGTTLFKMGWALRLSEDMTPGDDTNCNAMLKASTLTVTLNVRLNQTGGTYVTATSAVTFRASLWRYNPATDTGTLIAAGSDATQQWDYTPATGTLNTFKVVTIPIVIATDIEFSAGEILLFQVGFNTGTVPNPTLGTAAHVMTLRVDNTDTKIDFAPGQGIRQWCRLSGDLVGRATVAAPVRTLDLPRSLAGRGSPTATRAALIAKTFSLVGKATATHTKAVAEDFNMTGRGTTSMTRAVVAAKSFTLDGRGTPSRILAAVLSRAAQGRGTASSSKATAAAKTFSVTGKGVVTEIHPVQAFRTFNLVGKGTVPTSGANASTITVPIDEVPTPEGGGTTIVRKVLMPVFDD